MLVPRVAQRAAVELDELRAACDEAVAAVVAAGPSEVLVVGSGSQDREWTAVPDLTPYGVRGPWSGRQARGAVRSHAPLSLSVGAWLLDRSAVDVPCRYLESTGAELPTGPRTGLVVMADGTAKRSLDAPGYLDDRAAAYDADIAKALGAADAGALERLDGLLGSELWCRGVPALQALGRTSGSGPPGGWSARVLYDDAPYGVGYFVATWQRRDVAGLPRGDEGSQPAAV